MKLNEYKNILNKKNIVLYDQIYRITYHRLINLLDIKNTFQSGGGTVYKSPFNIIKEFNEIELTNITNHLLNKEYNNALNMCKIK